MKLLILSIFVMANVFAFEFVPENADEKTPVVFVLHGCKQDAEEFINDNYLLEKANGRAAIYAPSQSRMQNIDHCWNWFLPMNQDRGSYSETRKLLDGLKDFLQKNDLSTNPVYLMGFSAGAAQSMNFLACYPEHFKGAVIHSGLAYKVSDKIWDINDVIAYGPKRPHKELIEDFVKCSKNAESFLDKKITVFHGTKDFRVNIKNFHALEVQLVESYDLRDDGRRNGSFSFTETNHVYSENNYDYDIRSYKSGNVTLDFYEVDGLQHDWSGGLERRNRNDPNGISATDVFLKSIGL
tara:strand:- start:56860 stop:57747 length:888 start_codon:yes stop_codon:yes gene_type:complete